MISIHRGFAVFASGALCLTAITASAQSITECQQTVTYNIAAPAADVPANFRAFSGVWVGSWSNQLCSVLIVENIAKDGTVQTKYAWGSNAMWGLAAGVTAWPGKIVNGVLTLRQPTRSAEFRAVNPNELAGTFTQNRQDTGSFKRRQ
jgi:hypothetical protein